MQVSGASASARKQSGVAALTRLTEELKLRAKQEPKRNRIDELLGDDSDVDWIGLFLRAISSDKELWPGRQRKVADFYRELLTKEKVIRIQGSRGFEPDTRNTKERKKCEHLRPFHDMQNGHSCIFQTESAGESVSLSLRNVYLFVLSFLST